jgi:hypothetical protein
MFILISFSNCFDLYSYCSDCIAADAKEFIAGFTKYFGCHAGTGCNMLRTRRNGLGGGMINIYV